MALDPSLFVVLTCAQSVAVVIHSLHSALASGAVYCNRSCLCVCGGRAGGVRTLLQPACAQCLRLSGRFFHTFFYSVIVVQLTTDNDRSKRSEVEVE